MGTEILRPQDYLVERFSAFNLNNTNFGYQNGPGYTKTNHINTINNTSYGYKKPSMVRTDHKKRYNNNQQHQQQKDSTSPKRIPSQNDSRASSSSRHTNNRNDLEVGKVTMFMRGDSLDSLNSRIKKDRTKKTDFNPADLYAGSAVSVSPPPSSLPLPSFFKKQELKSFDDSATRDLRRLLNLE